MIYFCKYVFQFFVLNSNCHTFISSRSCTHHYSKTISSFNCKEGYSKRVYPDMTRAKISTGAWHTDKYTISKTYSISRAE
jgi:hypothetical protein